MQPTQSPAPIRAMVYYSALIALLITMGVALQDMFQLTGLALSELLIFLGSALFLAVYVERRPIREVFRLRRLSGPGLLKSLLLGVLAWALAQVLGVLSVFVVQRLGGTILPVHEALTRTSFPIALLVGGLLPAIAEEMAFRGYLQWSLGPLGDTKAVWLTGLLFGAMHLSLVRLVPLAVLGVLFAQAVQRAKSIFPSMIMHFANNGILLVLSFFLKPSAKPVPGLDPVPADAPFVSVAMLLAAALGLGLAAWSVARSFGPDDLAAAPAPEAEAARLLAEGAGETGGPAGDEPKPAQRSARYLLPLIPGALIYILVVVDELHTVFAHK